jgi:osmotically-inducible protein OsmY
MRRIFPIFLAALWLVGCAGNINPTRQIDDAALASSVRDALKKDPALRALNIDVASRRGEVTLTGVVRSATQRDRATEVARSVPGVQSVNNLLAVH